MKKSILVCYWNDYAISDVEAGSVILGPGFRELSVEDWIATCLAENGLDRRRVMVEITVRTIVEDK